MKKLCIALNALLISSAPSFPVLAQNHNNRSAAARPVASKIKMAQKVMLGCENPGTHQDVAKLPTVTNTTGQTLRRGTKLNWWASDGDRGVITLQNDLAPNSSITALGTAEQGYTCQAWTLQ